MYEFRGRREVREGGTPRDHREREGEQDKDNNYVAIKFRSEVSEGG